MTTIACKYAVLRFMPYPETGEFANVGVIAVAPKLNKLAFRLETKQPRRITSFFNHLDKKIFNKCLDNFNQELVYLRNQVSHGQIKADDAFELITKPKATILNFEGHRAVLLSNLEEGLSALYEDLVRHDFAKREGYEAKLQRRVKAFVDNLELENPFTRHFFEKGDYSVRIDLTQSKGGTPKKIIKPFYFDLADTKKACEHADTWIGKLNRLKHFKLLPKDIIFPIETPSIETDVEIYQMIKKDFENFGDVISANDTTSIKTFAQH